MLNLSERQKRFISQDKGRLATSTCKWCGRQLRTLAYNQMRHTFKCSQKHGGLHLHTATVEE